MAQLSCFSKKKKQNKTRTFDCLKGERHSERQSNLFTRVVSIYTYECVYVCLCIRNIILEISLLLLLSEAPQSTLTITIICCFYFVFFPSFSFISCYCFCCYFIAFISIFLLYLLLSLYLLWLLFLQKYLSMV